MSSSKKKANGAKEKPTKYDITIKYTDKDMPFILEEMTHRSNKDINNNRLIIFKTRIQNFCSFFRIC